MKKDKKVVILLIVIIIMQIIFKIYVSSDKNDFFMDELYSYGLMNYKQAFLFEEGTFINNWHSKEYFDEYLIVSEEEKNNLSPVYNNQTEDYHPPLYYLLLRIAASFTIDEFTKWTGIGLNILIFIVCSIVVFLIGNKIFKNKYYSLALVILYGFSKFSTENTLFIRMYQLLELQMLLLTNWSLKNYYAKNLRYKEIFKLLIIVTLGTLTQYYFLIFLIGISIANIINYIKRNRFKNIIKYLLAIILAITLVNIIFPSFKTQLIGNSERTAPTVSIQEKVENAIERGNEYLQILNDNMYNFKITSVLLFIALLGLTVIIIKLCKNYKKKVNLISKISIILIPTIFYWLIVTSTSPYIDFRYILPICVFLLIILFYFIRKELIIIIKNKKTVTVIMLTISIIVSITTLFTKNFMYQYKENDALINQIAEYKNVPCVYMYMHYPVLQNSFTSDLNYVRQFENVYIMNKSLFITAKLEKVLKEVDISNGIIIYDNEFDIEKRANRIIEEIEYFSEYKEIAEISTDRNMKSKLYLIY